MTIAYVGLGSNLDAPAAQIERALAALARLPVTSLVASSRLYQSPPWGLREQPDFVNAVAQLDTALPASDLMRHLLETERAAGRDRSGPRWGPRVLDLDLLLYADLTASDSALHLPHPRMHERAFVLLPLAELAPALDIPGRGPISRLIGQLDTGDCRVIEYR